jgi:hypothetical protein
LVLKKADYLQIFINLSRGKTLLVFLGLQCLCLVQGVAQEPCPQILSQPEERELLFQVSQLNNEFLHGFLSERQLKEKLQLQIQQRLRATPAEQREAKQQEMSAVIALHQDITQTQFKQSLLLKFLKGLKWDESDLHTLKKLGVKRSVYKQIVSEQAIMIKPFYLYLTETKGAQWDPEKGWDFSPMGEINASKIWEDPWLSAGLILFASPGVVMGIANLERTVAIPVDQTVFLPPSSQARADPGRIQIKRLDQYQTAVKNHLEKFGNELEFFLKASQKVNETLSSFSGILTFKWFSSDLVNAEEGERDRAYGRMRWHFNVLSQDYGIPKDLKEFMLLQMIRANEVEKNQIQDTLVQLDSKETAFYAASSVVLALYLAPIILPVVKALVTRAGLGVAGKLLIEGGAAGITPFSFAAVRALGLRAAVRSLPWALPGQTAVVTFGYVLPLTFGFLSANLHAMADATQGYGSYGCRVSKNLSHALPDAMAGGGWLAFIPVGGVAVQAVAAGLSGLAELGVAAKNTYQLLAGTFLTAMMIRNGSQNYERSNKTAKQAMKIAEQTGKEDVVHALSVQALKERLDAGVDFGFAAASASEALRAGLKGVSKYREMREGPTKREVSIQAEARVLAPVPAPESIAPMGEGGLSEARTLSEVRTPTLKEYWDTNQQRIVLTFARLGLTTGASALSIIVTYHTPFISALEASIGLGLISASLSYWGTDFYKYAIRSDYMTKAYAKRQGLELTIDSKGRYLDSKLEAMATQERRLYYFLTEIIFIGAGVASRAAAGIQVPEATPLGTLVSSFFSATATVYSQGEWDIQVTRFLEQSTREISQELMENVKAGKYSQVEGRTPVLEELAKDILGAKWERLPQLEALDPLLGSKFKAALNLFQSKLFLGSAISVASMVASLGPMPSMGYIGFGLLTTMGYSLRYSLELNEYVGKWRETGVSPILQEVVNAMETGLDQLPIVIPVPDRK